MKVWLADWKERRNVRKALKAFRRDWETMGAEYRHEQDVWRRKVKKDVSIAEFHPVEREPDTDLYVALQFLPELDSITLAVHRHEYIPYVRRSLFKMVGEPSRMVGNEVYYGRKLIRFVSLGGGEPTYIQKLAGIPREQVFLIETY